MNFYLADSIHEFELIPCSLPKIVGVEVFIKMEAYNDNFIIFDSNPKMSINEVKSIRFCLSFKKEKV
jgi:hypothetical protein